MSNEMKKWDYIINTVSGEVSIYHNCINGSICGIVGANLKCKWCNEKLPYIVYMLIKQGKR